MAKVTVLAVLWLSCGLRGTSGQQWRRSRGGGSGAWTQRIQWEDSGLLFRLLSTGSRYRAPLASTASNGTRGALPVGQNRLRLGPTAPHSHLRVYLLSPGRSSDPRAQRRPPNSSGPQVASERTTLSENSNGSGQRGDGIATWAVPSHTPVSQPRAAGFAQDPPGTAETGTVTQVASENDMSPSNPPAGGTRDPRDPEGLLLMDGAQRHPDDSQNSVFYNLYSSSNREDKTLRRPPHESGYGLPDLIPDPYYIQAATYIQHVQMYALRCAAEENCLARSAYRPNVSDLNYRVLLRFPQRVKNQGSADFLPVRPRHQWEWHSCHQ
ncbi:protein-lysine 6-oxidase-like [Arapaima gigas]